MNLNSRIGAVDTQEVKSADIFEQITGKPYYGPGLGPNYTPDFLPASQGADVERVLPEQHVKGHGPWTYAMLIAAGLGTLYVLTK